MSKSNELREIDDCIIELNKGGVLIVRATNGELFVKTRNRLSLYEWHDTFATFRHLLKNQGVWPTDKIIKAAINELVFQAKESPPQQIFVRVGEKDGRKYLDLCHETGQVVEIYPGGWRLITAAECPVTFYKPPTALALP